MKTLVKFAMLLILFLSAQLGFNQTLDEFIQKAEKYNQSGELEQAAKVMEEAINNYPDNSTAYSYLGLYRGMQAGRTQNYMEAGRLVGIAYEMLDKAIAIDPNNPIARFHRGLMSINVPPFLGKLDEGIQDLELLVKMHEKSPQTISTGMISSAYNFIADGYQKKQDNQKAIAALKKVIELAPGTELAKNAEKNISRLTSPKQVQEVAQEKYTEKDFETLKQKVKQEPDNPTTLFQLGKAYVDIKDFENAERVLKKSIAQDSTNIEAYKLLIRAIGEIADKGYDEKIYGDTDYRSNLAFEIVNLTDKAVKIAPNDLELRVMRGSIGVMMPFFVGKLDQAMQDLELVTKSNALNELKAEALYWLGMGYQKKATTYWIKVVTEYGKTEASKTAFATMRPSIKHLDTQKYQKPFLAIDLVLGFRDELPPQTAVWIEDKNGNFVKTVYVSGFSGFAKEKQANLSDWAKASAFRDVDAVTAASIDIGHHIYIWDLKDYQSKKVIPGEYYVKIEVAYWPSMEYQLASANIVIGSKDSKVVVEEGNLVPYLALNYYSDKK